jgi:hypothetical protein
LLFFEEESLIHLNFIALPFFFFIFKKKGRHLNLNQMKIDGVRLSVFFSSSDWPIEQFFPGWKPEMLQPDTMSDPIRPLSIRHPVKS